MAESPDLHTVGGHGAGSSPVEHLDDYELRHLVSHLIAAHRLAQVDRLFRLETAGGRNAWHEAREQAGDSSGYVADVSAALAAVQAAASEAGAASIGEALATEYRYALLLVSINTLAGRVPPALLAALVASGEWSLSDALTYARRTPDRAQRLEAFARLLPYQVLEADEPRRSSLATEALEGTDLHDVSIADAIALIVPVLEPPVRDLALEKLLSMVSSACSQSWTPSSYQLADALERVAPFLSQQQVENMVTAAVAGDNALLRNELLRALASMADSIAGEVGDRVTRALEAAAGGEEGLAGRVRAVLSTTYVGADPPPSDLSAVVDWAAAWLRGLRGMYPLNPFSVDQIVDVAADLPSELSDVLLAGTLEAARRCYGRERTQALAALARGFPEPQRTAVLGEAVAYLREPSTVRGQYGLEYLAPSLPPPLLREALAIVLAEPPGGVAKAWEGNPVERALAALAPYPAHDAGEDVIAEARRRIAAFASTDHSDKVDMLVEFARRLSGRPRTELLVEALGYAVRSTRGAEQCVATLAPLLVEEEDDDALRAWERAVRFARQVPNPAWRAEVLTRLLAARPQGARGHRRWWQRGGQSAEKVAGEALEAIRQIPWELDRARALAALIPHLPDEERAWVLDAALDLTRRGIGRGNGQAIAEAVCAIAPHLSDDQRGTLLAEAEAAVDAESERSDRRQARVLVRLATCSPPAERHRLLDRALEAARRSPDEPDELATVAPHLDGPLRSELLAEVVGRARVEDGYGALYARLREGLRALAPLECHRLLRWSPAALATLERGRLCSEVALLAPVLFEVGGPALVEGLVGTLEDVRRWWP